MSEILRCADERGRSALHGSYEAVETRSSQSTAPMASMLPERLSQNDGILTPWTAEGDDDEMAEDDDGVTSTVTRRPFHADKKKAVCEMFVANPGITHQRLADHFAVDRSMITRILRDKDKWLKSKHTDDFQFARKRVYKFWQIDRMLKPWLMNCRKDSIFVTDKMIVERALEVAEEEGMRGGGHIYQFKCARKWLASFKKRFGMVDGVATRLGYAKADLAREKAFGNFPLDEHIWLQLPDKHGNSPSRSRSVGELAHLNRKVIGHFVVYWEPTESVQSEPSSSHISSLDSPTYEPSSLDQTPPQLAMSAANSTSKELVSPYSTYTPPELRDASISLLACPNTSDSYTFSPDALYSVPGITGTYATSPFPPALSGLSVLSSSCGMSSQALPLPDVRIVPASSANSSIPLCSSLDAFIDSTSCSASDGSASSVMCTLPNPLTSPSLEPSWDHVIPSSSSSMSLCTLPISLSPTLSPLEVSSFSLPTLGSPSTTSMSSAIVFPVATLSLPLVSNVPLDASVPYSWSGVDGNVSLQNDVCALQIDSLLPTSLGDALVEGAFDTLFHQPSLQREGWPAYYGTPQAVDPTDTHEGYLLSLLNSETLEA